MENVHIRLSTRVESFGQVRLVIEDTQTGASTAYVVQANVADELGGKLQRAAAEAWKLSN